MSKLDLNKPVQLRNGASARLICRDAENPKYPLVALVRCNDEKETPRSFTLDGTFDDTTVDSPLDLINVPEPATEYLFIGGVADGRRIETAELDHYYPIPIPGGGTEEYRREKFRSRTGTAYVFVYSKMTNIQAFERLVEFYVAPDKPARKEDRLEEQLLRLLAQSYRVWEPELLFEQFVGHERPAARIKLWDLLADRKVELTWDRRLRLVTAGEINP